MEQPATKDYQPDKVDIGFAVLLLLTWTLLAFFGRAQHGRLPLPLAGLTSLCVLFSYSVALTGNCLPAIGWTWPRRQWYWLLGTSTGVAGASGVVLYLLLAGHPMPVRNLRPAAVALAVAVAPILEEVIFRGLILTGLLYLAGRLHQPHQASTWLSILFAALLFGLAHWSRSGGALLETVLMGIIYGWLRVKSGSTAVAAVAHSSFNLAFHLLAR